MNRVTEVPQPLQRYLISTFCLGIGLFPDAGFRGPTGHVHCWSGAFEKSTHNLCLVTLEHLHFMRKKAPNSTFEGQFFPCWAYHVCYLPPLLRKFGEFPTQFGNVVTCSAAV